MIIIYKGSDKDNLVLFFDRGKTRKFKHPLSETFTNIVSYTM